MFKPVTLSTSLSLQFTCLSVYRYIHVYFCQISAKCGAPLIYLYASLWNHLSALSVAWATHPVHICPLAFSSPQFPSLSPVLSWCPTNIYWLLVPGAGGLNLKFRLVSFYVKLFWFMGSSRSGSLVPTRSATVSYVAFFINGVLFVTKWTTHRRY
jgi:hypothetical protein